MGYLRRYLLPGLAFLLILLAYLLRLGPDGRVHIWLISPPVSGMLLRTPGGEAMLLDGGSDPVALRVFLGRHMSPLTRHLALAVLTETSDLALATQAEALERYPPRQAWHSPLERNALAQVAWLDAAERGGKRIPLRAALSHSVDGVTVTVWEEEPVLLSVKVGSLRLLYGPHATWDVDALPKGVMEATVWVLQGLRGQEPELVSLPPVVILASLPPQEQVVLRAPHTTFLIGEDAAGFHLVTDGMRYRWERSP